MDQIDRRILSEIQRDSRLSMAELGARVGLSASASHRRIRMLEEAGLIEGFGARLSRERLGLKVELFVTVSLASQEGAMLEAFEQAVRRVPEIVECYLLAGRSDYLMRIAIPDMEDYERLHRARLTRLPGVSKIETTFNLRTVTPFRGYPVPG